MMILPGVKLVRALEDAAVVEGGHLDHRVVVERQAVMACLIALIAPHLTRFIYQN